MGERVVSGLDNLCSRIRTTRPSWQVGEIFPYMIVGIIERRRPQINPRPMGRAADPEV